MRLKLKGTVTTAATMSKKHTHKLIRNQTTFYEKALVLEFFVVFERRLKSRSKEIANEEQARHSIASQSKKNCIICEVVNLLEFARYLKEGRYRSQPGRILILRTYLTYLSTTKVLCGTYVT